MDVQEELAKRLGEMIIESFILKARILELEAQAMEVATEAAPAVS